MTRDYVVHWLLGTFTVVIAFWGNKLGIPSDYVAAAGPMAMGIIGHGLAYTPDPTPPTTTPNQSAPQSPTTGA